MSVLKNGQGCKVYKGDHKPVNLYQGDKKIAGWHEEQQVGGGPLIFEGTYDGEVQVYVDGDTKQDITTQGKNLLDILSEGIVEPYTRSDDVFERIDITELIKNGIAYSLSSLCYNHGYDYVRIRIEERNESGEITYTLGGNVSNQQSKVSKIYNFLRQETTVNVQLVWQRGPYASGYTAEESYYSFDKSQIEEGIISSEYEHFIPDSPSPDYPSEVKSVKDVAVLSRNVEGTQSTIITLPTLRKIGDVADSYNPKTGEYVKRIGVKVFDGSEDWVNYTPSNDEYIRCFIGLSNAGGYDDIETVRCACNILKGLSFNQLNNLDEEGVSTWWQAPTTKRLDMCLKKVRLTTSDNVGFKTFCLNQYNAGTPLTVFYQLAEPIITYLNPASFPTFPGTTVIEQDGVVKGTITATAKVMDD